MGYLEAFMYDLGYSLFFLAKRLRKRFPVWEKVARWYEQRFSFFLNGKFVKWLEKHPVKDALNTKLRKEKITVSLTSFPARIEYVHIAIETLMRQSMKPDRIVLWLAESQFPDQKLPPKLIALQARGLTIRYCENLRSHKKYYYSFREYPEDNIILADDDLFYPRDTVKRLMNLHRKHPEDIVCVSAQIITPTVSSLPSVWQLPQPGKRYTSCWEAQAFTGAGSLFPAHWYPEETMDKEKSMELATTADDLWLKAMSLNAGVLTTLLYPSRGFPVEIMIRNNVTLYQQNRFEGGNKNDQAWELLINEYGNNWQFPKTTAQGD